MDECNINATALSSLLTLPRNLKSLALEENIYHRRHKIPSCPPLNQDIAVLLSALSHQQHSLEHLRHTCPPDSHTDGASSEPLDVQSQGIPGFSNFKSLKTLELGRGSALINLLRVPRLAPTNLETFRFKLLNSDWENHEEEALRIASATLFKHLELHMTPVYTDLRDIPRVFMSRMHAEGVVRIARILKEMGRTTTVIGYHKYNCIPPYLYADRSGAPTPTRCVVFCSERFWVEEKRYAKKKAEWEKGLESRTGSDQSNEINNGTDENNENTGCESASRRDANEDSDEDVSSENDGDDADETNGTILAAKVSTNYKCPKATSG